MEMLLAVVLCCVLGGLRVVCFGVVCWGMGVVWGAARCWIGVAVLCTKRAGRAQLLYQIGEMRQQPSSAVVGLDSVASSMLDVGSLDLEC